MEHGETRIIPMTEIAVADRIRKDNGSLDELADNIRERGLINPITVMENAAGGFLLIAGLRRLEAYRLLGNTEIRATVLSPMAADEALMIEIAENEQRKEFTISERLDYAAKIREVEKEKARERKSIHARDGYKGDQDVGDCPHPEMGRTRDVVAEKSGFSSSRQLRRAEVIAEKRPDLLEKIDNGETTIYGAYMQTREPKEDSEEDFKPDGDLFVPDEALRGVPVVSEAKLRRRLSKQEREAVNHIKSLVVTANPVEIEPLDVFDPDSVPVSGDENSIEGAKHDRLLANPVYAALYEKYIEAVRIINVTRGELRSQCEAYEKRIRSYEENRAAASRMLESLRSECAALQEARNAGE